MNNMERNQRIMDRLIIWGCDVQSAMPRFLNNANLYCQMLRNVPAQESFAKLGTYLESGDCNAAFEQAHALKGVLANMALTPMVTETCEIVELLRKGTMDNVPSHYAELLREKAKLQDILLGENESLG